MFYLFIKSSQCHYVIEINIKRNYYYRNNNHGMQLKFTF